MNYIKKGTMMGATTFLLATAIGVGTMPQMTVYADEIQTPKYRNYYINNELQTEMYFIDGETFVPGVATAKAFGLKVDDSVAGIIKITNNGNEYVFKRFANYYTKNGEKVYIKEIEQNGVKVPDSKTVTKNNNGNLYIPVSFFENELGLKFGVDSSNNLYVGSTPTDGSANGSMDTQPSDNNNGTPKTRYSTENSKKSIDEGWVAPTLKSTSTDDLKKDAQILIKELEFVPNGTQADGSTRSAKFDIMGLDGHAPGTSLTVVGPFAEGENASHWNAIIFQAYRSTNGGSYGKLNQIDPQVLRFYYPTSWEWLDKKLIEIRDNSGSDNIMTQRYTIDGRDTVINGNGQIVVYMSQVGGNLQGRMLSVSSSGTIGSATSISSGSWVQSNGVYYFKDSSGNIQKGWVKDGGNWYCLDTTSGVMRTGWIQDGGKWYYCWSNGQMASNTTVGGYKLGSNGAWVG